MLPDAGKRFADRQANPIKRCSVKSIVMAILLSVATNASAESPTEFRIKATEQGRIVKKTVPYGHYWQYVPRRIGTRIRIAVIVHGTPGKQDNTGLAVAETFIKRWIDMAEKLSLVIISPAFDQKNFGGQAGPGGGYRGLFGREISADGFVNYIVDQYKTIWSSYDGRIYLYGHSAGGQFASRYVVRHPERVIAAVISAAGSFAFPAPDIPWAGGMAPLRRRMRWSNKDPWQEIDITPNPNGWVQASELPITVVVGAKDDENHIEQARHWVNAMNEYAQRHEKQGQVRFVLVRGVGHNSAALTPRCQQVLMRRPTSTTPHKE